MCASKQGKQTVKRDEGGLGIYTGPRSLQCGMPRVVDVREPSGEVVRA